MENFPFLSRKDGKPIRYLVVDDSVFARKNVAKMVESFGGQIVGEAGDGCTAITEYEENFSRHGSYGHHYAANGRH